MLQRTPIFLQCNTLPWVRQFIQERMAFLNRSYHHIDLKQSRVLEEIKKEANLLYFGLIMKELTEYDRQLPSWTHSKTDPIWDLQNQAKTSNDKTLVNWVLGDSFKDFLQANMNRSNWTQFHGILTDETDRINACRSFILDTLDPFDKDQTIWSTEYSRTISAWLLALAGDRATDYFWNIDNFDRPFILDSHTREEIDLQDVDCVIYESLRKGFVTVSLLYQRM